MRYPRIYVDKVFESGAEFALGTEAARHVVLVLKRKSGQTIHVFNGTGGYYIGEIIKADRRDISIKVKTFVDEEKESSLMISLVQGISRGQHMDYTVQKAVELGVAQIVPVITEFSNVRLDAERAEKRFLHWQKIIISACEQCGRNRLPELLMPISLAGWLEDAPASLKLMLEPGSPETLSNVTPKETHISLLAGPEGGFSETELDLAQTSGVQMIGLGPRVLRTETAAVAALSAIQTLWGDMG